MKRLVIAGPTADNCVLFTAHDAYLRDVRVVVPTDAVASQHASSTERALAQMKESLKADLCPVSSLRFGAR